MEPLPAPGSMAASALGTVKTHHVAMTFPAEWTEAIAVTAAPQPAHPAAPAATARANRPNPQEQADGTRRELSVADAVSIVTTQLTRAPANSATTGAAPAVSTETAEPDAAASDIAASSSRGATGRASATAALSRAETQSKTAADADPRARLPPQVEQTSDRIVDTIESDRAGDPQESGKPPAPSRPAGTSARRAVTARVQQSAATHVFVSYPAAATTVLVVSTAQPPQTPLRLPSSAPASPATAAASAPRGGSAGSAPVPSQAGLTGGATAQSSTAPRSRTPDAVTGANAPDQKGQAIRADVGDPGPTMTIAQPSVAPESSPRLPSIARPSPAANIEPKVGLAEDDSASRAGISTAQATTDQSLANGAVAPAAPPATTPVGGLGGATAPTAGATITAVHSLDPVSDTPAQMQAAAAAQATTTDTLLPAAAAQAAATNTVQPAAPAQAAASNTLRPATAAQATTTDIVQPAAAAQATTTDTVRPATAAQARTTDIVRPAASAQATTTNIVQPAASVHATTADIVQPAAAAQATTTDTVRPATAAQASATDTVRPAASAQASTTDIVRPAAAAQATATDTVQPAASATVSSSASTPASRPPPPSETAPGVHNLAAVTSSSPLAVAVALGSAAQTPHGGPQEQARGTGSPAATAGVLAAGNAGTTGKPPSASSPGAPVALPSAALALPVAAPATPAAAATTDRAGNPAVRPGGPARSAASAAAAPTPSPAGRITAVPSSPVTVTALPSGTPWVGPPTSAGGLLTGSPTTAVLSTATGNTATGGAGVSPTAPPAPVVTPLGYTPATPDAMAASIVAMYRSGQSSLVLRLDPPGLGAVSVHLALGGNAVVNVLFVPAVAQTAHLLQTGLGDLRQAMAASGLTLGQAQIGGGASGGAGGGATGGNPGTQPGATSRMAVPAAAPSESAPPETAARGARAIA